MDDCSGAETLRRFLFLHEYKYEDNNYLYSSFYRIYKDNGVLIQAQLQKHAIYVLEVCAK